MNCGKYVLNYLDRDDHSDHEIIVIGNFYMKHYFTTGNIIVSTHNNRKYEIILEDHVNDFTHEEALRWINKLKIYQVFQ